MAAGALVHFAKRFLTLMAIGLLISYPVLAQKGKSPVKSQATGVNATTHTPDAHGATAQSAPSQSDSTGSDLEVSSASAPAKPPIPSSAKPSTSAAARQPASATVKPPASSLAQPPADAPADASAEPAQSTPAETGGETQVERVMPVPAVPPVPAAAETPAPVQGSAWTELVKTIGGVGLIISLILGGYVLFRRFAPQYVAKRPNERNLRLLETLPMGDKRSLSLIQAGGLRLLLASTPGQITLLTSLSDAAEASSINAVPGAAPLAGNFRNLYEQEKKAPQVRPAVLKALPPDIRSKMQELRKALEG